jgi:hypothetical protein
VDNNNVQIYVSFDADAAGRKIGRAILADSPDQLKDASDRIELGNQIVQKWAAEFSGICYSSGGDQGVYAVPPEALDNLEQVRADYNFATGLTLSVGIGNTLSESGKSLLSAKFRGKDQIVQYDESVEQDIQAASEHMQQGTASQEEQKLSEAYLSPEGNNTMLDKKKAAPLHKDDCPYCKEMEDSNTEDPDHCQYCHDMDQESDCPYCAELENQRLAPDDGGDSQQIDETGGPQVSLPTTTDSQNFEGQDFIPPDMPKPSPVSENPPGLGVNLDVPTNSNENLNEQEGEENEEAREEGQIGDEESAQTAESILQEIDEMPAEEIPAQSSIENIDAADLAIGSNMEDNISRPEGFEEDVPGEMGLSEEGEEESPDITSVLQEGLDSHAGNIQRERVVDMVAQALEGFKGCKDILERAKEQAPQLYASSLAMLKAMIEMAKLLGLDKEAEEQSTQGSEQEASPEEVPQEEGDYNNLFPEHPDHSGDEQHTESGSVAEQGQPNYNDLFPAHPDNGGKPQGKPTDPKFKGQLASR